MVCGARLCCAGDGIPDVVLAAPFASNNVHPLRGVEAGAVFVLDGARLPAFGTTVDSIVNASAARSWGEAPHGRLGSALAALSLQSPPTTTAATTKTTTLTTSSAAAGAAAAAALLASAPMTSTNTTEMGGMVVKLSF